MENVLEVAKYLISKFPPAQITSLKLQKLLYYSQAWNLAIQGKPLFDEPIEAWVHGPVVRRVFNEYKEYRWRPLPYPETLPKLSGVSQRHLDEIVRLYGQYSAVQLEHLTHADKPWLDARKGLRPDQSSSSEISCDGMLKFYRAQLNGA